MSEAILWKWLDKRLKGYRGGRYEGIRLEGCNMKGISDCLLSFTCYEEGTLCKYIGFLELKDWTPGRKIHKLSAEQKNFLEFASGAVLVKMGPAVFLCMKDFGPLVEGDTKYVMRTGMVFDLSRFSPEEFFLQLKRVFPVRQYTLAV